MPLADVEADSGGHTNNRPLTAMLPTILRLASEIAAQQGYAAPIRVGAAGGGRGAPGAVAAAFALGASYVLTGSVNQSAVEAGISQQAKELLAQADVADVIMAPAADMFELGVELHVLRRGTMFAVRAQKLYDLYSAHESLDAIPEHERVAIERNLFRASLTPSGSKPAITAERDPREVERAEKDPKHKMALVCRWYLGKSSRWAIDGDGSRRPDFQVWCGPAMGAFNAWVEGSFLEPLPAPHRRADRPQPDGRRRRRHPRPAAAQLRRRRAPRRLRLPPPFAGVRPLPAAPSPRRGEGVKDGERFPREIAGTMRCVIGVNGGT